MSSDVAVVMPALNEADALAQAFEGSPSDVRLVVVDNGSTDDTAGIARSLGAEVVSAPVRGFGSACKAGLDATDGAEVIVYMDADATCDWQDLRSLYQPILDGRADLVLGRRVRSLRQKGAMPFHVDLANAFLGRVCGYLAGVSVHDVPPYRAIRRSVLLELDLQDRTYGWPLEMVLRAGRSGKRVIEVPVHYKVRAGTSKVTGTARGTLSAMKRMLGVLWQYRARK